jgi:uncharacterized protein
MAGPGSRSRSGRRGRTVKIVVTGPFDAGKTTYITHHLGDHGPVDRAGRQRPDVHGRGSGRTTVAMDFGRITVDDDLALYLFGTPGQARFEFMWDILAEGMLGFVLMVDASRADAMSEARRIRDHFTAQADVPYVVAVNKLDGDPGPVLEAVRSALELPDEVPVVAVDARDREDVKAALLTFLRVVRDWLRSRTSGPAPQAARTGETG